MKDTRIQLTPYVSFILLLFSLASLSPTYSQESGHRQTRSATQLSSRVNIAQLPDAGDASTSPNTPSQPVLTIAIDYTINDDMMTIKVSDGGNIYEVTDNIYAPEYDTGTESKKVVLALTSRLLKDKTIQTALSIEPRTEQEMWGAVLHYLSGKTEEQTVQVGSIAFHLKPTLIASDGGEREAVRRFDANLGALKRQIVEVERRGTLAGSALTQTQQEIQRLSAELEVLKQNNLRLQRRSPHFLVFLIGTISLAGGILAGVWGSFFAWPKIRSRFFSGELEPENDEVNKKINDALDTRTDQNKGMFETEISQRVKEIQQEEKRRWQTIQQELSDLRIRVNQLPNRETIDSKWRSLGNKIREQNNQINELRLKLNIGAEPSEDNGD